MPWTDKQQEAIDRRGNNILVAAAAGSGKTAVLVQRIVDIIMKEQVPVHHLLVVTFTNAAAAEMKERIRKKLMEQLTKEEDINPQKESDRLSYIRSQLMGLSKASISTMHSFCIDIIRKNFHLIDIDPSFKIANESTVQILKSEALRDTLNQFYEEKSFDFHGLVDAYGGKRDDSNLQKIILDTYDFIRSQPKPMKWLHEKVEDFIVDEDSFEDRSWARVIREDIGRKLAEMRKLLEEGLALCQQPLGPFAYQEALSSDIALVDQLKQALENSLENYRRALSEAQHVRLKAISKKAIEKDGIREDLVLLVKELREQAKDIIKEQKENLGGESLISQIQKLKRLYPLMKKLSEIVETFHQEYMQRKLDKGLLDFNDLEHYALRILEDKGVSEELRNKYQYIFFDEYQDSNIVQETILSSIQRSNNLFLVGDVKQSIYRFRLSDPTLFIRRYEQYSKNQDSRDLKIDLSSNFRSRKNILDFINYLFERLMSKELGEIDYNEDAALRAGICFPENRNSVELALIENTKKEEADFDSGQYPFVTEEDWEDTDSITLEAIHTANRIKDLVGTDWYDPKEDKIKKLGFNDMVILMRSQTGAAEIFMKTLTEQEIPCYTDYSASYFQVPEIKVFLDFLRIIDNFMQDEALMAVMYSIIGGFTPSELSQIRIYEKNQKKCSPEEITVERSFHKAVLIYRDENEDALSIKIGQFLQQLQHYQHKLRLMKLDEFMWYVLSDCGYHSFVAAMPGGAERQQNIAALIEKAVQYQEMNSGGLFGFLRYVDKLLKDKTSSSEAKVFVQQAQVVRLMSIHKSKGLEFPVVFLCRTGKGFNKLDMRQDIMLHSDLGLGPKYVNTQLNTYSDSIAKKAIKIKANSELLSEELRILYVAMTRAIDRLIILGSVADVVKASEHYLKKYSKASLMKKNSFLAWIMTILSSHPDASALRAFSERTDGGFELHDEGDCSCRFVLRIVKKAELLNNRPDKSSCQEKNKILFPKDGFVPDPKILQRMEERFSFTYPFIADTISTPKKSVTALIREEARQWTTYKRDEIPVELPKFMEGKKAFSSMEKGSILHQALESLDINSVSSLEDVQEQIRQMVEKEILTKEEAESVSADKIYAFVLSDMGQRIQRSQLVMREEEFLLKKGGAIINGIIDCYFQEDDELILVDYKTDRMIEGDEELKLFLQQKYRNQLELYKEALEKSTGKKVKEGYLYFFDRNLPVKVFE